MGSSPWKFANPTPIGFSFVDMSFINNSTGLAVGVNGGIARTTDSGRTWVAIPYKYVTNAGGVQLANFADVHFVTPTVAYAVGGGGVMVKSTDGGLNWAPVTTPLTALARNINAVHFLNKDTGYIGGAALTTGNTTNINDAPKVYFTRNGGSTWDSLASPFRPQQNNVTLSGFNNAEIHRIHFVNDSVGYASGSCGNSVANFSAILWKINKHAVQDYSIHRTKFGITATTGSYTPATQTFKGLVGINDSLVLISSLNNNVVIRVRTGKNDSTANAAPAIYGAYERGAYEILIWINSNPTPFPANLSGAVAGQMQQLKKDANGKIYLSCGSAILTSTDNGTTWNYTKPHPATVSYGHWTFNALDITPNGRVVIGTFNGLTYDSLPGSAAWKTVYTNVRPLFHSLSDMDWADVCNGVAVGSNGTILKTTDGGKTWVNKSNTLFEATQTSISAVVYHNVNSMFFPAGRIIYKSVDQGTTNDALFTDPNPNFGGFNAFTMVGPDRAYAVGYRFNPEVERTMIYRSLNANSLTPVWDTVKTFPLGNLAPQPRNIKFANQDTGYVSCNRGKVYRTINGGLTWTDVSPDTTVNGNNNNNYTALSVVAGRTLYVGGASRKLFRSTDAGATWTDLTLVVPPAPTPVTAFTGIANIIMNDASNGYINANGILLKTADGWATWTYDIAPGGLGNIYLYPKMTAPLNNKKVYGMPLSAGSPVNSTNTAFLLEYGDATFVTLSTSEAVDSATCTNPSAGRIVVNATGGIAPYTYSINGGAYQSSNTFTGLTQGAKTISIKDASCQTVTKSVNVGFTDDLTLTAGKDTLVCPGAPVPLLANANTSATYTWAPAAGLSNPAISNPVATVSANTLYTVTASLNGCTKTRSVNIGMKPAPAVNAGPDKTIVDGAQVMLDGSGAASPVSIAWTPGLNITNANTYTPTVSPRTTTTYTLTVKDANNCTSIDNTTVTVIPYCVKVMDAFTPNGDGINDRWLVTTSTACTQKISAAVFNRYGQEVYKNNNYQNDWQGTYSGKPLPDGTYYYVVTYTLIDGKTVSLKGYMTILR